MGLVLFLGFAESGVAEPEFLDYEGKEEEGKDCAIQAEEESVVEEDDERADDEADKRDEKHHEGFPKMSSSSAASEGLVFGGEGLLAGFTQPMFRPNGTQRKQWEKWREDFVIRWRGNLSSS